MRDRQGSESLLVIDGLIISNFGPPVFKAMRSGGITAANCTCGVWEDFPTSMKAIAQWKIWFRTHSDSILQVYGTEDILRAKKESKTGIILGWQNTSGFVDYLPFVQPRTRPARRPTHLQYRHRRRQRMLRIARRRASGA